jgi:hypothetical protein
VLALVTFAAEETSKTPYYVSAGALAAFAVVISAIGISRHETFPPSKGASRVVMLVCALIVAATMVSAVLTG